MLIDAANFSEAEHAGAAPRRDRRRPAARRPRRRSNIGRGLSQYGRITHAVSALGRHRPRARLVHAVRSDQERRRRLLRDADRRRDGTPRRHGPPDRGRRRPTTVQDNVPPVVRDLHVRPDGADLPDRRRAAARLHVHRTRSRSSRAPSRTRPTPTNVDATLAAQNLGLLEVRSVYDTDGLGRMGDRRADRRRRCRPAAPRDPEDRADRPGRHARAGRRPRQDEGSGRPGLQLRAGALHPRGARRRAAAPA